MVCGAPGPMQRAVGLAVSRCPFVVGAFVFFGCCFWWFSAFLLFFIVLLLLVLAANDLPGVGNELEGDSLEGKHRG